MRAEDGHPAAEGEARPARLEAHLRELRALHGDRVPLSEVGAMFAVLLRSLRGDPPAPGVRLYAELEELARYIQRAKLEINAIRSDDAPAKDIRVASGELDAIGTHLEQATGVILDACEELEAVARRAGGEPEARISDVVTRVYEACSFQDITGQRITKVVQVLRTIEERIARLVAVLGREVGEGARAAALPDGPPTGDGRSGDAALLNGPQPPGLANSQADIDALFADLGR